MVDDGDRDKAKRRGPRSRVTARGNRSKAPRCDPGASQSCVSDDDFVSPLLAFLSRLQQDPIWNAPDGVLTDEEDDAFPRIKIRSTGSALITECPPRLLRWLLANFDSTMRTFDLGGGRSLVEDERDVELLLGFPRGPVEMVKRDKLEISNMLKHWRGKFEKTRHTVTCAEPATKVKALVDGGLWFKRHFALLLGF
nr:uncharacterized protein LOC109193148 isoform X1 [Ipomoea batatas]